MTIFDEQITPFPTYFHGKFKIMAGIEKMKAAIAGLIELFMLIMIMAKDKKGWWFILTKIAPKLWKLKKAILTNWGDIKVEYKDLDDDERAMLSLFFKQTLKTTNTKADTLAKTWWDAVLHLEGAIRKTISLT